MIKKATAKRGLDDDFDYPNMDEDEKKHRQ